MIESRLAGEFNLLKASTSQRNHRGADAVTSAANNRCFAKRARFFEGQVRRSLYSSQAEICQGSPEELGHVDAELFQTDATTTHISLCHLPHVINHIRCGLVNLIYTLRHDKDDFCDLDFLMSQLI